MKPREIVAWIVAAGALAGLAKVANDRSAIVAKCSAVEKALPTIFRERDLCTRRLNRRTDADPDLEQAFDLLGRPGTLTRVLSPQNGSLLRAVVVVNAADHRAVVLASVMQKTDEQVLEAWTSRGDGAPTRSGLIKRVSDTVGAGALDPALLQTMPDQLILALGPHARSAIPEHPVLSAALR